MLTSTVQHMHRGAGETTGVRLFTVENIKNECALRLPHLRNGFWTSNAILVVVVVMMTSNEYKILKSTKRTTGRDRTSHEI